VHDPGSTSDAIHRVAILAPRKSELEPLVKLAGLGRRTVPLAAERILDPTSSRRGAEIEAESNRVAEVANRTFWEMGATGHVDRMARKLAERES
jgi:hypothetical protein